MPENRRSAFAARLTDRLHLFVGALEVATAMPIPAKYENGVFKPLEAVQIKEETVVEVHFPIEQYPTVQCQSIEDLPFLGMWKDRADTGDSVEYVNRLRDNPRG